MTLLHYLHEREHVQVPHAQAGRCHRRGVAPGRVPAGAKDRSPRRRRLGDRALSDLQAPVQHRQAETLRGPRGQDHTILGLPTRGPRDRRQVHLPRVGPARRLDPRGAGRSLALDLSWQDTGNGHVLTHPGRLLQGAWCEYCEYGRRSAAISCPTCSRAFSVLRHQIAPDGTCSPSVVCPWQCGFHDWVRLLGWVAA